MSFIARDIVTRRLTHTGHGCFIVASRLTGKTNGEDEDDGRKRSAGHRNSLTHSPSPLPL